MKQNFYAVIMAGGGGTRLWPLSRKSSPKQLLKLIGGKSLFQMAVERLDGLVGTEQIFVVTIQSQVDMLHEQVPAIPMKNYLIEPMPKGTAAVVGFAAEYLRKRDPNAVMAVLTADHVMENTEYFKELLARAVDIADSGTLVTIGIKPEFASTGFGYIQTGVKRGGYDAYVVQKFVEKPDENTAQEYFKSGDYFWNSGMFIWSVEAILLEIEKQMPELYGHINLVSGKILPDGRVGDINKIWGEIEPETIDYGIMEGARDVTLIPAIDLGWKDLGSWDSLFSILKPDKRGNIELAPRVLNVDASDCFIQTTNAEKVIAVIGVEGLIIVDHENTLLICKKGDSQNVKQIVNSLKDENLEQYL